VVIICRTLIFDLGSQSVSSKASLAALCSPEKCPLGLIGDWSIWATRSFFSPNVEGIVVDKFVSDVRYVHPFRIYSRPKSKGQKSGRNLDVIWPSQIFGGGPSINCMHVITPASWHVVCRSFVWILPLALKLLRLTCWILRQILNFRDSHLGGPPSQLGCVLVDLVNL